MVYRDSFMITEHDANVAANIVYDATFNNGAEVKIFTPRNLYGLAESGSFDFWLSPEDDDL